MRRLFSSTGSPQQTYTRPNEWIIDDLVVPIFGSNGWVSLGRWARTCKGALWAATQKQVLSAVIQWINKDPEKQRRVPRWLLFSLPYEWIWPSEAQQHVVKKVLPQCRALLTQRPQKVVETVSARTGHHDGDDVCLTGGFVTRLLYEKEWYSDFDLFCSTEESPSTYKEKRVEIFDPPTNREWDLVFLTMIPTHQLFEEFDLSIVQHGYCLREDRFYTTPLALYTYLTHDIVVTPTYRTVTYFGAEIQTHIDYQEPSSGLWKDICHCEQKHRKKLHDCKVCVYRAYAHMRQWRRRVRRYALQRFPGFTTSYCRQCDGEMTTTTGQQKPVKKLSDYDVGVYED